jgi:RHS repeat-associated protein
VGFQDKDNGSGYDYTYDPNGNMKSDYNKSITSIIYNYLNLPGVVTITGKGTITYTYDAAGNKLQKTTLDQTVTPNKTTNYYYAGDYVYRSAATGSPDTLEFIAHPEGRLRPVRIDTSQAITIANLKYIYDYYLKDHLGSVRSVLTTEQQTDIYAATMETAAATKENALFSNVSSTATTKPAGFSNDVNNKMVSRLNGNGLTGSKRVGPGIILKVMTGDTISISTYSWYLGAVQPPPANATTLATELLPLLTAGVAGQGGTKGGAVPAAYLDPLLGPDIATMLLKDSTTYVNTRPKAFLNWMVVGEDYVAASNSPNHVNALQVPTCNAGDTLKQMVGAAGMVVRRNGWIYIYLSNESSQDVFFDNLVINLRHGPLVEQKDYYAFGMENPGLSTKAIKFNYKENRLKFNGKELQSKEFSDSSGLEWEDYGARMYDPQIARWMVIDPLAEKSRRWTPYNYTYDNPIRFIDPDGMGAETIIIKGSSEFQQAALKNLQKLTNTPLVIQEDGTVVQADKTGNNDEPITTDPGTNISKDKPEGTDLVNQAINSSKVISITESNGSNQTVGSNKEDANQKMDGTASKGTNATIKFNPNSNNGGSVDVTGSKIRPPQVGLAHELKHAVTMTQGKRDVASSGKTDPDGSPIILNNDEVITRQTENKIRNEQGVKDRKLP